jgi:hypothetical protein
MDNLIKRILREEEEQISYDDFRQSKNYEAIRNAYDKKQFFGVCFFKDNGEVRTLLGMSYIKDYIRSTKEKSQAELDVKKTHNLIKVVDLNVYKQYLKEGLNKSQAVAKSFRNVKLANVIYFVVNGVTYNFIKENELQEKVENSDLTIGVLNKLINSVESPTPEIEDAIEDLQQQMGNEQLNESKKIVLNEKEFHLFIKKVLKEYYKK